MNTPEVFFEKESLAALLKSSVLTQEKAKEALDAKYKDISKVPLPLTKAAAQEALGGIFKEASALRPPFGATVEKIMRMQGITKIYRGKEILDVSRASKLTGLNPNIFRTNMYKSNCVVDMSLVISISIGLKLSSPLVSELLHSAGLAYRLDNPEHIAYMFLVEYCKDLGVKQCNEILEGLGVRRTRQLGSYARGGNGEFQGYDR